MSTAHTTLICNTITRVAPGVPAEANYNHKSRSVKVTVSEDQAGDRREFIVLVENLFKAPQNGFAVIEVKGANQAVLTFDTMLEVSEHIAYSLIV